MAPLRAAQALMRRAAAALRGPPTAGLSTPPAPRLASQVALAPYSTGPAAVPAPVAGTETRRGPFHVTTLPNGLRVASLEGLGQVTAVGVLVDAGSRYETPDTNGVSHLIDRLAFKVG